MRQIVFGGLIWLSGLHTALAQTALNLSATGAVLTAPDEIRASLNAQASASNAAAAQADVNRLVAKALDMAKGVPGVNAATSSYNVYQPDSQKPAYQASQTINLIIAAQDGAPPDGFTSLIGKLQQDGLILNSLDGDLSAKGQDTASQAATIGAIHRLQAQAAAIAATLGDTVGDMKVLNINGDNPGPVMPAGRMMMAMASPPPQAAPGPITVQVTISAVIELKRPATK